MPREMPAVGETGGSADHVGSNFVSRDRGSTATRCSTASAATGYSTGLSTRQSSASSNGLRGNTVVEDFDALGRPTSLGSNFLGRQCAVEDLDVSWRVEKSRETRKSSRQVVPAQDRVAWGNVRNLIAEFVECRCFDFFMGFVIIVNFVVMGIEANSSVNCDMGLTEPCPSDVRNLLDFCATVNKVLLAIYILEVLARLFTYRLKFFFSMWNTGDILIVLITIVDMLLSTMLPSVQLFRMFRMVKLLRVVRMLGMFSELNSMMVGFIHAMKAMFWGIMMIFILVLCWSIMAVEIIQPVSMELNHDGDVLCEEAFSTVLNAVLTFFQTLVAGDSWGRCSIPVIKASPPLFFVFAGAFVCVQLGFMNLILSVIVDTSAEARDQMKRSVFLKQCEAESDAVRKLLDIFAHIDIDGSGSVTLQELVQGFKNNNDLKNLFRTLRLEDSNVEEIFRLVDNDCKGEVDFQQFFMALSHIRGLDPHFELMRNRLIMTELYEKVVRNPTTSSGRLDRPCQCAEGSPSSEYWETFREEFQAKMDELKRELFLLVRRGDSLHCVLGEADALQAPSEVGTLAASEQVGEQSSGAIGCRQRPPSKSCDNEVQAPSEAGTAAYESLPASEKSSGACGSTPQLLKKTCSAAVQAPREAGIAAYDSLAASEQSSSACGSIPQLLKNTSDAAVQATQHDYAAELGRPGQQDSRCRLSPSKDGQLVPFPTFIYRASEPVSQAAGRHRAAPWKQGVVLTPEAPPCPTDPATGTLFAILEQAIRDP